MEVIKESEKDNEDYSRVTDKRNPRRTFQSAGKSQMGLSADLEGLSNEYKNFAVMEQEVTEGLKVKQVIEIINKAVEEGKSIVCPGFSYDGCKYNRIIEEEKKRAKPKKAKAMQLLIQEQFLRD